MITKSQLKGLTNLVVGVHDAVGDLASRTHADGGATTSTSTSWQVKGLTSQFVNPSGRKVGAPAGHRVDIHGVGH